MHDIYYNIQGVKANILPERQSMFGAWQFLVSNSDLKINRWTTKK